MKRTVQNTSSWRNPFSNDKRMSKRKSYLYWLCEDDDFKADLDAVIDLLPFGDIDGEDRDVAMAEANNKIKEVSAKHDISNGELMYILGELQDEIPFDLKLKIVERNTDGLIVKIPAGAIKTDYLEAWDYIDSELKSISKPPKKSRQRAEVDGELIYAVHKALKAGKSYNVIAEQYTDNKLPNYSGKTIVRFRDNPVEICKYYNLYKPRT